MLPRWLIMVVGVHMCENSTFLCRQEYQKADGCARGEDTLSGSERPRMAAHVFVLYRIQGFPVYLFPSRHTPSGVPVAWRRTAERGSMLED